jgi:hypothetical protein
MPAHVSKGAIVWPQLVLWVNCAMKGRENDYISAGAFGRGHGQLKSLAGVELASWCGVVQLCITASD